MIDWTPIVAGAAVLINAIFIPWAISAYQRRTGVQVTDQQRQAVYAAIQTAAGIVQTKLDQGALKVTDIHPDNPDVIAEARAALASVPDSAAAQNTSLETVARKVVATVDTSPKPAIVIPAAVAPLGV